MTRPARKKARVWREYWLVIRNGIPLCAWPMKVRPLRLPGVNERVVPVEIREVVPKRKRERKGK